MMATQNSLMVESSYPDLVINVGKVTLGERNRNKLKKSQKTQEKVKLLQAVCALLNSGGGVILIKMANEDEQPVEMGLDLEEALRGLIQSSDFQSFFEMRQQGRWFYIFVKSWSSDYFPEDRPFRPRICSLSSSLYRRSATSAFPMDSQEAFSFLKTKKQSAECSLVNEGAPLSKIPRTVYVSSESHFPSQAFQRDKFERGEIMPFPESQFAEFKQFATECINKYLKSIIPEYISAFANNRGGYLFIGVDDKSKKVLGCPKENVEFNSLENTVKGAVSKLPIIHFCSSRPSVRYEMKKADVFQKGELYGYLLMIKVESFCCAVFSEAPNSWMVKDKEVCSLTTKEWVEMMMMDINADLAKAFESQLSISHSPPSCRPVYSKKGLEHKEALQQHLFPVQPGHLQHVPNPLWKELCSQHEGLKELVNQQVKDFCEGILILSRSWAMDLNLPEEQEVICDALLIAKDSPPVLYTILGNQRVDGQLYCTRTAFALKQKPVNTGGYTGKLCVLTRVLHLSPQDNAGTLVGSGCPLGYPEAYNLLDTQQMETLLQSLVIVLLGFRSFLSDQLGCEILNLLTEQQYEIFSKNLHKNRELFIHGLPGSGKTVLAMKIMEKIKNVFHCEKENILYICENIPLRNFISYKETCKAVTRKHFMNNNCENIQHIIIDEAQNFRTEDGEWYEKAKLITRRKKGHPGILWIFLDYFQTSHSKCSGLPALSDQNSREELTRVVRNADSIANYLIEELQKVRENPPLNIPAVSMEMLLQVEWTHCVQGTSKIKRNLSLDQMMTFIANKCKDLFERGYSPRDVAVLVSTEEDVEYYKYDLKKALRKNRIEQIRDAEDVLSHHIVLDSVRRFSGLERVIVFGIHPRTVDISIFRNFLVCLASRARQQLYILYH